MDISETERALNKQVALALKLQKTAVGMTYDQIADKSELSTRTVKRYLNGEREIGVGTLITLARAMRTTARDIITAADQAIENSSK